MNEQFAFERAAVAGLGPDAFMAYGANHDLDAALDEARDTSFTLFGERGERASLARLDDTTIGHVNSSAQPIGTAMRAAREHLTTSGDLAAWRVAGKAKRRKVVVRTDDLTLDIADDTKPGILTDIAAPLAEWLDIAAELRPGERVEWAELSALTVRHQLDVTRRKGPSVRASAVLVGPLIIARDLTPGEAAKLAKQHTASTRQQCDVVALVSRQDGASLTVQARRKRLSARFKLTVVDVDTATKPAGWLFAARA